MTDQHAAVAGRVIVITGASRGLGSHMARHLGGLGVRLGLCARSPVAGWEHVPDDAVCSSLDVTDHAAVEDFTAEVAGTLGAIDVWVNNAGLLHPIDPVRDTDPAAFAANLSVNVSGVFVGSQAFVRHRRSLGRPGGFLVNISSGAARKPYAGWGAYCAAKAAVDRLSEVIAVEEADIGLQVIALAPGVIDTDMQSQIRATPADRFPAVERFHQLKADDDFADPARVADHILRLAFDPAHATDDVLHRYEQ